MRIFVAGATGVVGRQLVPRLVANGHEVTAMVRGASLGRARGLGATPVVANALDAKQVQRAVNQARPDAIIHELTAVPAEMNVRHFDRDFEMTNRLRTEGTDNLLAAGREAGVERFVAQSYAGMPHARIGGPVKSEDDPLDTDPPRQLAAALAAIRHLEEAVTGADWTTGIVLRYGGLFGPGTSLDREDGTQIQLVRERKYPIVGDGGAVWSFLHVEDAAEATVAAVEHGVRGIYNIVDDDPQTVAEWLPELAQALGAKPPRHVPAWLVRLLAGEVAVMMMTEIRGASNEKAKRVLGWEPQRHWREEFGQATGETAGQRFAEVATMEVAS